MSFDFSQTYVIPQSHESTVLKTTPATDPYLVGDRIDILIRNNKKFEPLLLDAVVTQNGKGLFGMLVPKGGKDLLEDALKWRLALVYRRSIAVGGPLPVKLDDG